MSNDGVQVERHRHCLWQRHGVEGNKIGTNAAGTAAIANGSGAEVLNGQSGIEIDTNASGNSRRWDRRFCRRNLVSGNTDYGIAIDVGSTGNTVEGNYVGTDYTGNAPLGAGIGYLGVLLQGDNNTVGGARTISALNPDRGNDSNPRILRR